AARDRHRHGGGDGHRRRRKALRHPPEGGHGLSEPRQSDRGHRGGRGRGLCPGEPGRAHRRDAPPHRRRHEDDRHLRAAPAPPAQPVGRAEAAGGHRRGGGHEPRLHRPGRGHRHAGPPGPGAGDADHPPAEPGHGHHGGGHHPLYGRSRPGRPGGRDEPGPHRHGGDPHRGVQPDRGGPRPPSGRAPGRRAAGRAGQGRHPHARRHHRPGRLRAGSLRAVEVREGSMASIIKAEHLSYVYNPGMPGAVTALDDVSFEVEEGDFVGIIGATGSGKSTLIGHMNGLNKPTSGKIFIDGRDVWADPSKIRDFRFLTGLVFQYPEYQLFEETCYKDIAFGPRNMGLEEKEIDRRVREAARFVGLDEALLSRSPFELSGGQKRRVAVAGVMAMEPRILVLDEPAAGLDPEGRDSILSAIKRYHKDTGTTVLLVSHSMEDIARYADKVLVMAQKHVAMYDTVERVFARAEELLALGLSVPQVTKIFLKLREMGIDVPADVYTIPYAVKKIVEAKARRDAGES